MQQFFLFNFNWCIICGGIDGHNYKCSRNKDILFIWHEQLYGHFNYTICSAISEKLKSIVHYLGQVPYVYLQKKAHLLQHTIPQVPVHLTGSCNKSPQTGQQTCLSLVGSRGVLNNLATSFMTFGTFLLNYGSIWRLIFLFMFINRFNFNI